MKPQDIDLFLCAAVECSVYAAPLEPGLTFDELLEVGKRAGLQPGEIGDGISRVAFEYFGGSPRFRPDERITVLTWDIYVHAEEPDYRNFAALDFVMSQFNEVIRSQGRHGAKLERAMIVERAAAQGIARNAVEVELTILILTGHLVDKNGVLTSRHGLVCDPLPSVHRRNHSAQPAIRKPMRRQAYPIVKDVVERRVDGRLRHAEPFDAFADALTVLGYGMFRMWWIQMVSELRQSGIATCPASVLVISAALVEGVLTFVVKHGRSLDLGTFKSKDFDADPRTWKIDDLVNSAARGGDAAILERRIQDRANRLIQVRQRIHAGRMLSEYPSGPPDLRPDEAREAKETAEQVVRAVLDWLQEHPS
jgi:hypothetical protein